MKNIILDTNILLNDPRAIFNFAENHVVIPMTVLEELDNIKGRENNIAKDARVAIRTINKTIDGQTVNNIRLSDIDPTAHPEATLSVGVVAKYDESDSIKFVTNDSPDNDIINVALSFVGSVLVSNDVNMRIKAICAGQHSEEYSSDRVVDDVDHLPTGYKEVDTNWLDGISDQCKFKSCGGMIIPASCYPWNCDGGNIGFYIYNEELDWVGYITDAYEDDNGVMQTEVQSKRLSEMSKRRCAGIIPKNIQQTMAIDALMNTDCSIAILNGPAGSGKTLLALAAASEMCKGKKKGYRVDEVLFARTEDTGFAEIGFLPGDEKAKVGPWLGAAIDNMEVIARESKDKQFHPSISIDGDEAFIHFKSLGFFRGRSFNNKVVIIDEAQNLTATQVKTILSRAGEHCKFVLMGNLKQIDNDFVSANSSGLTYASEKLRAFPGASIIQLDGVFRSPLAEFVEETF